MLKPYQSSCTQRDGETVGSADMHWPRRFRACGCIGAIIILAILTLLLLPLFAIEADGETFFRVQARLRDEETRGALPHAQVILFVTGLGDSKQSHGYTIGESGDNGEIDCRFTYSWGRRITPFTRRARAWADVVVCKFDYTAPRFHFDLRELPHSNGALLISLGDVALGPLHEK
jgi:hypothetical protein